MQNRTFLDEKGCPRLVFRTSAGDLPSCPPLCWPETDQHEIFAWCPKVVVISRFVCIGSAETALWSPAPAHVRNASAWEVFRIPNDYRITVRASNRGRHPWNQAKRDDFSFEIARVRIPVQLAPLATVNQCADVGVFGCSLVCPESDFQKLQCADADAKWRMLFLSLPSFSRTVVRSVARSVTSADE